MKDDNSRLHDAGRNGLEVLLEMIGAVFEYGFELIACLLEGVGHF